MSMVVFIVILFIVVLVHEGGHFLTAKLLGVKVEEFGFGLPPRLKVLFKKGETLYSLNWLPIGGFVKLYGEDSLDGQKIKDKNRAFAFKPLWVKAIILLAGVTANFLLAGFLFSGYYFIKGIPIPTNDSVSIVNVVESSPAAKADLREGDKIELIYINNGPVIVPHQPKDVVDFVTKHPTKSIHFKIRRYIGYRKSVLKDAILRPQNINGQPRVGIVVSPMEIRFYPFFKQLVLGFWFGFKESVSWLLMILLSFKLLLTSLIRSHTLPQSVSGPVGIYKITSVVVKTGWLNVARLTALISVNLAVVNLLPVPALDGGRFLLASLTSIYPSHKTKKIEYWLNMSGMIFLLLLMVLITINDVVKLIKG